MSEEGKSPVDNFEDAVSAWEAEQGPLPSEIVGLEEISPYPNILIFAKSGAGKTVWGCSDDRVLVLNCEPEGTLSAKMLGSKARQWTIRNYKDWEKATDWLKRLVEEGKSIPFDVVFVDSLTALQKILMRDILDDVVAKKPSRDPDVPDRPEYLKNQLVLMRQVRELNALPVVVVWSALVKKEVDPEGNEFLFPDIQGRGYGLAQEVLADMTCFGYLYVKPRRNAQGKRLVDKDTRKPLSDRIIQWEDMGSMQGKDRSTVLGASTKNKTLKEVRERMQKAINEARQSN
ncbi:Sak4-like ssDNA annealing protein [Mycobacterium phage Fowlmouth]|uniref:AAA-ATPase n=1 Tax=Mycobacterium phage Fowlmouth TaxID=2419978 RepID=A0A3G2KGE2_9CAUD|nr:Sak4-like ssDNA annealing protein [Mycobacterium phage Fowlmouth]AYN58027.1 AAA-ATPase [Mycobacterium phage Fowlmouth]